MGLFERIFVSEALLFASKYCTCTEYLSGNHNYLLGLWHGTAVRYGRATSAPVSVLRVANILRILILGNTGS
jgi:hypothetical protein